jgi:type I restriction enzyme, R subunit
MDKYTLSERDICTKFITPAVRRAGWDVMSQIREEIAAIPRACRAHLS